MSVRRVLFTSDARDDHVYWQGQRQDRKTLKRINRLIRDAQRTPVEGIGRPEPLKANLSGLWSRRIDDTNRLVYAADDLQISIVSCRYHYE
ncbi:Txe/YoeB family addiction module toxin [Burkholderia stabilis]|uniref:Putative mRNA interferase YoeB n=1 Tax=Burkholderia stabilis TaxID=95485 RepID=A0AAJ5T6K8_9BURK|nr:Txe/YoeB family addiction module toxin [Burkholderia stabilis]VBB14598.1 putative addiction module toxin [Burkholderia stabilis]